MQRTINAMMSQLHFVMTANHTNKFSSLMWKVHPNDLSQGIHPFCVGFNAITALQELASKYNLISLDGATPSLLNARELVGGGKVAIPQNLT
jgi:hypothetical protein